MARTRRADQTEADRSRQLNAAQAAAVELVVAGQPDTEVAEAVGVTRQTVLGWRHYHPGFQAALNARRREVYGRAADRLRALLGRALGVLEAELEPEALWSEARLKTALKVLEFAGAGGLVALVAQTGPEDADAVLEAAAARRGSDGVDRLLAGMANGSGPDATDALRREWAERLAEAEAEADGG